jgi:hypothetical protein
MPPKKMQHTKQIALNQAKCTQLSFDSAVRFRAEPTTKELTGFDIEAYTGAVVDRWWGKLVVAIDGITASQQMPIFKNHDHNEIVGYSTSISNDGSFSVQGLFSSATEAAQEVKALDRRAAQDHPGDSRECRDDGQRAAGPGTRRGLAGIGSF